METHEELLSVIINIGRVIKEKMHSGECDKHLAYSEMETMKFLSEKKSATMKEIAHHLHVKPASATVTVDNLVKSRKLSRVKDKNDRRIIYIQLTKNGSESLNKKYKQIHMTLNNIFGKLSDKDKDHLLKILKQLQTENV